MRRGSLNTDFKFLVWKRVIPKHPTFFYYINPENGDSKEIVTWSSTFHAGPHRIKHLAQQSRADCCCPGQVPWNTYILLGGLPPFSLFPTHVYQVFSHSFPPLFFWQGCREASNLIGGSIRIWILMKRKCSLLQWLKEVEREKWHEHSFMCSVKIFSQHRCPGDGRPH